MRINMKILMECVKDTPKLIEFYRRFGNDDIPLNYDVVYDVARLFGAKFMVTQFLWENLAAWCEAETEYKYLEKTDPDLYEEQLAARFASLYIYQEK